MNTTSINKGNVGRIAERIVSNELEYHGFRVSDLNKDGLSANADLLAVKKGIPWQIQVKGSTYDNGWWFNYGYCDREHIDSKECKMFNRANSFYKAQIVALVCVKSPKEYCCIVLPIQAAEEAVQLNLNHAYRIPNKNGSQKKPGKVWTAFEWVSPKIKDESRRALMAKEQATLKDYEGKWDIESMCPSRLG